MPAGFPVKLSGSPYSLIISLNGLTNTSLPFLNFSNTTPTFIFEPPAAPNFTKLPEVFTVTISPTSTEGAEPDSYTHQTQPTKRKE